MHCLKLCLPCLNQIYTKMRLKEVEFTNFKARLLSTFLNFSGRDVFVFSFL